MLSGLRQSLCITPDVPSLIAFWNAGVNAYRAHVTYAVESRMSTPEIFTVFKGQNPLLKHIYNEARAFKHSGWKANTNLFRREDDLTTDDIWQLTRFGHDVVARELQIMEAFVYEEKHRGLDRFDQYAKENFLQFPPLNGVIRGICRKFALQAAQKKIVVDTSVTSALQFANADIFDHAKSIIENLVDNSIKYGREGGHVNVSMGGMTLYVEDDGCGMDQTFADRLLTGGKVSLREKRIKGVKGDGIGWRSIKESAAYLGWRLAIKTSIEDGGSGTQVMVMMNENDFASKDIVERRNETKKDTRRIMYQRKLSAEDILQGAFTFANAQPFLGYRCTNDGEIGVYNSPIFQAIKAAKALLEPLEEAKKRSQEVVFASW